MESTSGLGKVSVVPSEVKRWNWAVIVVVGMTTVGIITAIATDRAKVRIEQTRKADQTLNQTAEVPETADAPEAKYITENKEQETPSQKESVSETVIHLSTTAGEKELLKRASGYLNEKKYDVALAIAKAVRKNTTDEDSKLISDIMIAESYYYTNHLQEAIGYLQEAIEINPFQKQGYSRLAFIYVELGDSDKAIDILKSGLAQREDQALHVQLGALYMQEEKYQLAQESYSNALKILKEESHEQNKETIQKVEYALNAVREHLKR